MILLLVRFRRSPPVGGQSDCRRVRGPAVSAKWPFLCCPRLMCVMGGKLDMYIPLPNWKWTGRDFLGSLCVV